MARRDWSKLQAEYEQAFHEDGVSIKQWCANKGINYNTARRYLKVITKSDQSEKKAPKLRTPPQDTPEPKSSKHRDCAQDTSESDQRSSKKKFEKTEGCEVNAHKQRKESDQFSDQIRDQLKPRNHLGHFQPGNKIGFQEGNTHGLKHGAYASRIGDLDAMFDAGLAAIDDEIRMCRARVMIAMNKHHEIEEMLEGGELDASQKVKMFELYKDTDIAIDRNVGRVESLLKTKATVRKAELEAERIASEQAGLGTAIADIVAEVQAMESNGFVVH